MRRVILFAKVPRPGAVKTRLTPPLRPEQALGLYAAFLEDQLALLRRLAQAGCAVELCSDLPWETGSGADASIPRTLQGEGDLGARLRRAAERAAGSGAPAVVFLGADTPTLPAERVLLAFERLARGAEAVIAPAEDGGYVLLGVRGVPRPLFAGISWGTSEVLAQTRERAARAGIALEELPSWYDVDDAAGLWRLERGIAQGEAHDRAPATLAYLRGLDSPEGSVL